MSETKSSLTVAGVISARFNHTVRGFSSVNKTTCKAEHTTLSGNNNAQNSLTSIHSRGQRIANAITRDGNHIHSKAQEFSLIDQTIKQPFDLQRFSSSLGGGRS